MITVQRDREGTPGECVILDCDCGWCAFMRRCQVVGWTFDEAIDRIVEDHEQNAHRP